MPHETRQATCDERVASHMESRLSDLRLLWKEYCGDEMEPHELAEFRESFGVDEPSQDEPGIYDFGLSFDYCPPGTWTDQQEGFWRWQFSTGGPGDELRFFSSGPTFQPYKIQYWFLDWFDGAHRNLRDRDLDLGRDLWDWFADTETTKYTQEQAMED